MSTEKYSSDLSICPFCNEEYLNIGEDICDLCQIKQDEQDFTDVYHEEPKIKIRDSYDEAADIIRDYLRTFNKISIDNKVAGSLSFLTVVGSLLHESKIFIGPTVNDMRTHVLWIQPSRSGKSESYRIIDECVKALGIREISLSKVSDAGLEGSFEKDKFKPGELNHNDIMHWEEANYLFGAKATWQSDMFLILQNIMDTFGTKKNSITKRTAGGKIHIPEMKESVWLTTTDPNVQDDDAFNTGRFQRMLCWIRNITLEDNINTRRKFTEAKLKGTIYTPEDDIEKIMNRILEKIPRKVLDRIRRIQWWEDKFDLDTMVEALPKAEDDEIIKITAKEEAVRLSLSYNELWKNKYLGDSPQSLTLSAAGYCDAYEDHLMTAAGINCILRGDNVITKRDVEAWAPLITKVLESFLTWYGVKFDESKIFEDIKTKENRKSRTLTKTLEEMNKDKEGFYDMDEFIRKYRVRHDLSPGTIKNYLTERPDIKRVAGKGFKIIK